ncbi:MAG: transposase [Methylococcales bacterium]
MQIGDPVDLSLNADVRVAARDRAGLERLLRYCARPVFASARIQWIETDRWLVYCLPKLKPDGQTILTLTPLEFLDKLAVLIPPPRKHRHRYCPAFWLRMHRYAKR